MARRNLPSPRVQCMECLMFLPDYGVYHPHLHCVLFKAYHRDPAEILAEHGYRREVVHSS